MMAEIPTRVNLLLSKKISTEQFFSSTQTPFFAQPGSKNSQFVVSYHHSCFISSFEYTLGDLLKEQRLQYHKA